MSKYYFMLCIMFAYSAHVSAKTLQQKPAPAKPVAAAPKGNPPYVLKKDFEAQVQEMNSKVSGAVNSTAALRRNVGDKLEKVIILFSLLFLILSLSVIVLLLYYIILKQYKFH